MFNANIGDTANGYPDVLDYNFSANKDVYLQVEVSSNNSTFETLAPRQRVSASAFAQVAGAVSGTGQSVFGTTTPASNSVVSIFSTSTNSNALTIGGFLGQLADLFHIQDYLGNTLFSVGANGSTTISNLSSGLARSTAGGSLYTDNTAYVSGSGTTNQLAIFNAANGITSLPSGNGGQFLRASSTSPTGYDWAYASSSGTGGVWGSITGLLSDQTDLQTALDAKLSTTSAAATYQPMNAASAELAFSPDQLSVVSIAKSGSIMTLWPQDPTYSNSSGVIDFAGVALTPGFTGSNGQVLSITFQAKAQGTANIQFSSSAVLANDGLGTNILTGTNSASFTINKNSVEQTQPSTVVGASNSPDIQSSTYPDSNSWYTATNGVFAWGVPTDTTAVRILVSQNPSATPSVLYQPPITSKEVNNLSDGVSYFSVQLENASGWGMPAHFKFQIDTQPPAPFSIRFVNGTESDNPQPKVFFTTTDAVSGVAYYMVQIDQGAPFCVDTSTITAKVPYILPLQTPGTKTITVTAYDQAGNITNAQTNFIVDPLVSPVVINYPTSLIIGNPITVTGTTNYPNAQVARSLQKGNGIVKSFTVQTQNDGSFTFTTDQSFEDGTYALSAIVTDGRGAMSNPSEKLNITFSLPAFIRIGSLAISVLEIITGFFILLFLLALEIWYARHRYLIVRKKIRNETRDAENVLHKAFLLLKEDVKEQMQMLEKVESKRQLTAEETKIIQSLKKDLEDAETYVRREIDTIDHIVE